ncbi:hypothetical protein F5X99DRAFT_13172 [Biscogniauxia marginata]|nr:hypothetical protein F5X99DRAFT_13172 [Biscogniauxia marginata]
MAQSSIKDRQFHLFPYLPVEIRLQIWEYFALPAHPALHVITVPLEACFTRRHISRDYVTTIRALMQVNQESRICVLHGNEMVIRVKSPAKGIPGFRRISFSLSPNYFFANPKKDIFHIRSHNYPPRSFTQPPPHYFTSIYKDTWYLSKITNLMVHEDFFQLDAIDSGRVPEHTTLLMSAMNQLQRIAITIVKGPTLSNCLLNERRCGNQCEKNEFGFNLVHQTPIRCRCTSEVKYFLSQNFLDSAKVLADKASMLTALLGRSIEMSVVVPYPEFIGRSTDI